MIKKIFAILLSVLLCLPLICCSPSDTNSNNNNNNNTNIGDDENNNEQEEEPMKEKSLLLFQIDPGLGGRGLTTSFSVDDPFYLECLNNIAEGLQPLKEKFDVAVLINPQHSYIKDETSEAKRVKDGLIFAIDQFEKQGIKVVLEIYSSDNGTNQNGELARLPKPNLHYGDGQEIAGITMDMDTLSYIKLRFPDTVLGVRMHELVGTHEIAMNGDDHGFLVTESTIKAIIDTCDQSGMNLYWSDHSWDGINDPNYNPNDFFVTCIDYAVDKLENRVTFIWANNNWDVCDYVGREEATFPYKNYRGTDFGLSNQSWIWESYSSSNTYTVTNGVRNTKWYAHSEMDTPIEVLAGYTLDFLEQGASVIQFEPDYYFFNTHNTPWMNKVGITDLKSEGNPMFYEEKPDFSARINLKRFIDYLLADKLSPAVTDHISDFVDGDRNTYYSNTASNPYKKYVQTTIAALGEGGLSVYDRYIYTPDTFVESESERFYKTVTDGEILFTSRINALAKTNDDFLVVKRENGANVGYVYNAYSGLVAKDTVSFADDENGTVVGVTAGNFIQKYNYNVAGDPDEVIVAREKDGQINFTIYKAMNTDKADYYEFKLEKDENSDTFFSNYFGSEKIDAANFNGIVALGARRSALLESGMRNLDELYVLENLDSGIKVYGGTGNGSVHFYEINCGNVTAAASADVTITVEQQKASLRDELCVAVENGGTFELQFYTLNADNGKAEKLNDTIKLQKRCEALFTLRLGLYYMDV